MKEEKKRRIEETKKTQMGWSKPRIEWPVPKEEGKEVDIPEGQMRAEKMGKRSQEEVGGEGEEEERRMELMASDEDVVGDEAGGEIKKRRLGQIGIMRLECLVSEWVEEVGCQVVEEEEWEEVMQDAWDDVHEGYSLDPEKVKEGREEEITFMEKRGDLDCEAYERVLGGYGGETDIGEMGGYR